MDCIQMKNICAASESIEKGKPARSVEGIFALLISEGLASPYRVGQK